MSETGDVALRNTPERGQADEWMLVLAAENLSPAVHRVAWEYVVSVPADQSERASAALAAYDFEHVSSPDDAAEELGAAWGWVAAFGVVAALLCFFLVTLLSLAINPTEVSAKSDSSWTCLCSDIFPKTSKTLLST